MSRRAIPCLDGSKLIDQAPGKNGKLGEPDNIAGRLDISGVVSDKIIFTRMKISEFVRREQ